MRVRDSMCLGLGLLVSACGSRSAHREDSVATTSSALTVPAGCPTVDFDVNAPDPSSIALTFDDGPEYGGTTMQTLDILKSEGVVATFFINTDDAINVLASSSARLAVQRMVAEGHQVGDHTVHHYSLGLTSTDVTAEVSGVIDTLRTVAPGALSVRLTRAPYGEPYFGPQARLDEVAPIVARYGVHIGWNMDSRDWACTSATDPAGCVKTNVLNHVDAGRSGIVLLHSTRPATVSALRDLIAALRTRGKKFIGVEELVVAKYGKPSRRLFRCASSTECWGSDVCGSDNRCGAATTPSDAGPTDTGIADTGIADAGIADTGKLDTGSVAIDSSLGRLDSGTPPSKPDASAEVVVDTSKPAALLEVDGPEDLEENFEPRPPAVSVDSPASETSPDEVAAEACAYAPRRSASWWMLAIAIAFAFRYSSRGPALGRR